MKKILITGGAGFIGSNLVDKLVKNNYNVTVIDNLSPQIHGDNPKETSHLYKSILNKVNFIYGDIRNKEDVEKCIGDNEIIIHLASETGTGQSMYEISRYVEVNSYGTSNILDYLANNKNNVKKIILASSRAVYGEGKYRNAKGDIIFPKKINIAAIKNNDYDFFDNYVEKLFPIPTTEDSQINPTSIYAITKFNQEQILENACYNFKIPFLILRFQNVYGPGQSLNNSYTGIITLFTKQILKKNKVNIFEDGLETRDFIYINDVVDSICQGINNGVNQVLNVGSGTPTTVIDLFKELEKALNTKGDYFVSGNHRKGDIRHNYADISMASKILGFKPKYNLSEGLKEYAKWAIKQEITIDNYEKSINELKNKDLFI